jgi:hypothetical protein
VTLLSAGLHRTECAPWLRSGAEITVPESFQLCGFMAILANLSARIC